MFERLRVLFRSLEIRLLVPLSITVGTVLAVHAILNFRATKEHYLRFVDAEIDRSSGLIRRATHDGMLLNRLDEVQATIERLAEEPDVAAIRVYDKVGSIVLSSAGHEIGKTIALASSTCQSCHGEEGSGDADLMQQRGLVHVAGGSDVLRHLAVIENDPACGAAPCHYHPPEERVLGILEVEMSMAPVDAALGATQRQLAWTTIILIVICGGVAGVFIRRLVHQPVVRLNEGTRRIAAGNLDTRIDVPGNHQLARLAEAFNRMVDDLRAARQELSEWSRTLEEKVEEKTKQLQRAQHEVLHMEKMASLGKLSATVAHELNNPISGVLTYSRLVRRGLDEQSLDAEVRAELDRYLSLMDKECSRCGAIVHNMLTFARRTGAEMEPTDLNEVLDRSLMLVRHHLEMSNVSLQSEPLAGDSVIVADAGQIEQALVALVVNAVEAMDAAREGCAEITVRLTGNEDGVLLEVADTGAGIEPEVLPQIFEPFFSTKGNESGVGLGLAVVYGIVQRHGGTIDVDSTPGHGATFRLRLPRRPEHAEGDGIDAPATPPRPRPRPRRSRFADATARRQVAPAGDIAMMNEKGSILVVDDEFSVRDSLYNWFKKDGLEVCAVESAADALALLPEHHVDVALVDIKMPGMDGIELQERIRSIDPEIEVIIITAFASVETAVRALKQGAFDYVTKPIDPDELSHLVQRALEQRRLKEENIQLRETIDELVSVDTIVGDSPPMRKVLELVQHVAQTDATVLVVGESGTGKELIARAIHANSRRRYLPIVAVNCGAIPESLLESELFGHEKGAFTGADHRLKGKLELADGGTLFLDEIGAIPSKMQVDLLRVLEDKQITRLGGTDPIQIDFRVICATNDLLEKAVDEGRFRDDLYYRVNVFTIEAPPLRARPTDIPLLANHFLHRFAQQMDKRITGISLEAMKLLVEYGWPGNVRELSNAIERAMVVGKPPSIKPEDLPVHTHREGAGRVGDSLVQVEKRHIQDVLNRTNWNITHAAKILKVDRVTVYNKMKKYGLRHQRN